MTPFAQRQSRRQLAPVKWRLPPVDLQHNLVFANKRSQLPGRSFLTAKYRSPTSNLAEQHSSITEVLTIWFASYYGRRFAS
jgi:hypothetical protein